MEAGEIRGITNFAWTLHYLETTSDKISCIFVETEPSLSVYHCIIKDQK